MRRRNVRVLLAVVAALGWGAGAAVAGEPVPQPLPSVPVHEVAHTAAGGCASCAPAAGCDACDAGGHKAHAWGGRLRNLWLGPNGGELCDMPVGCSTCEQEKCFIFGSCRQFFGHRPYVPPPGIIPPPTTPCDYGTFHRW